VVLCARRSRASERIFNPSGTLTDSRQDVDARKRVSADAPSWLPVELGDQISELPVNLSTLDVGLRVTYRTCVSCTVSV
jgi:hypothetical protein